MKKLVLLNTLTLSRIPLSLIFCSLILFYRYPLFHCITLFAVIGASDFLDGKLARRFHLQTRIGAKLDVFTDFFFIVTACLSWVYLKFLPSWIVWLIVLKFIEFLITSSLNKDKNTCHNVFCFDIIGKTAAVMFYLLPAMVLLLLYSTPYDLYIPMFHFICILITIPSIASSLYNVFRLLKVTYKPFSTKYYQFLLYNIDIR